VGVRSDGLGGFWLPDGANAKSVRSSGGCSKNAHGGRGTLTERRIKHGQVEYLFRHDPRSIVDSGDADKANVVSSFNIEVFRPKQEGRGSNRQ
jgi:hypothetical protein